MIKINPDRPDSGWTMTVGELISELSEYPDNMPVIAEWESVYSGIRAEDMEVMAVLGRKVLIIYVENYG